MGLSDGEGRRRAEDLSAERCFLREGTRLRPDVLALAAAVGHASIAASFLHLDGLAIRHLAVWTVRRGQALDVFA